MVERLPSLRARVVWSSTGVAALVGLLAASSAVALVRHQQQLTAERRLLEAGELFAGELAEAEQRVRLQVDDENEELQPLGMRLALFEGARCLGGDPALGAVRGCVSLGSSRACALERGSRRVVVAGPEPESPGAWWLVSILLGSLLSAGVGALVSLGVGTWALRSLLTLQRQVSTASIDGELELGPRAPTAEVEALRAALESLVSRLKASLERSRVFASSAAHELRTPLSTISAELELMTHTAPTAEKEAAARAQRTLKRLTLLVDRLLALARGEHGPQRPFETVALEDVVRETVSARSASERERVGITIDDAGMIRGDEPLLGAIVDNLVDNSLKFSSGPVLVQVSAAGEDITLSVTDRGPGVAALPSLLEPFVRGDTSVGGHGLGLAIVNRAVELHHAALTFEGSTVRVRFPRWVPLPG